AETVRTNRRYSKLQFSRSIGKTRFVYQCNIGSNGLLFTLVYVPLWNDRKQRFFSKSEELPNPTSKSRLTRKVGRQKCTSFLRSETHFCIQSVQPLCQNVPLHKFHLL